EERDDLLEDPRVVGLFEVGEVARLERPVLAEPLEAAAVEQVLDPPLFPFVRPRDRDEPIHERRCIAKRALRQVPRLERDGVDRLPDPGHRGFLPELLEPSLAPSERAVLQVGLAVPLADEREIALPERPPLRRGQRREETRVEHAPALPSDRSIRQSRMCAVARELTVVAPDEGRARSSPRASRWLR